MKHIEIELAESEQKIVKFLAQGREKNSRAKNYKNRKVGRQDQEQTELEGMGAELAAAKILNVCPDLDNSRASIHDFIFNGYTVDVKTTKYFNGKLILPLNKNKNNSCEYYILMVGEFPRYRFIGAAKNTDLINDKNIGSLGYDKIYMLEQSQLKNLEEFLDETKARA